jgi:hypothetical protein
MKSICAIPAMGALLSAILLLPADSSLAAAGDEHWDAAFGLAGTTNYVRSLAWRNNQVYVGGFPTVGTNSLLFVLDGYQCSRLGRFSHGSTPYIYDLAFLGDTLYAAGYFTNVDGVAATGLARWDGNTWSSVAGFNGSAFALAVEGTNLFVGGYFTNAGPVAMTNVGYWDGSAWHALGPGLGVSGNSVSTLAVTNGVVYAGGFFSNSGGLVVSNLAQWNGSSWSAAGGGANGTVYALVLHGTDLYAAGAFTQVGTTPASYIARWNGANWSTLGTGLGGIGTALAVFNNRICASGNFTSAGGVSANYFAVWDGSSWAAAGSGLENTAMRLVPGQSKLYVGGYFGLAGGLLANQVATWDGTNWGTIGPAGRTNGASSTVRTLFHDGTNLYVGGSFAWIGTVPALRVARWDGYNWYAFGSGLNSNVTAIAAVGTNVYAGGDFTGGSGGPLAYHLARWTGTNWYHLSNTAFASVSTLAVRSNDLFVAGYFTINSADGTASWLTRWDGTNFWNVIIFDPYTLWLYYIDGIGMTAMAIQRTNIYLSGHFSLSACDSNLENCTNCDNVMRFDGVYARVMGSGLNSNATAIAVIGSNVYFGGKFTMAGGLPANGIARWDGNTWSSVGGSVVGNGTVSTLAAVGQLLYMGGTFTNVGGVPINRLARWDGTNWSALGSGTIYTTSAGTIVSLTGSGSDLYVGGTFRTAGGKPSYFLGRWNEARNFDLLPIRLTNPHWATGAFKFSINAGGLASYVVEGSTNLTAWTPLLTNSLLPYDFYDSNAPGRPRQSYRVHSWP